MINSRETALAYLLAVSHLQSVAELTQVGYNRESINSLKNDLSHYVLNTDQVTESWNDDEEGVRDEEEGDEGLTFDLDDDEEDPVAVPEIPFDGHVYHGELEDLASIKARVGSSSAGNTDDKVEIKFSSLPVVLEGEAIATTIDNVDDPDSSVTLHVAYVRRSGKVLELGEVINGKLVWHTFGVAKFNSDAVNAMFVNETLRVSS